MPKEISITKSQFRWLLTCYIVVAVLGMVTSFVGETSLAPPLRDYLASQWEADPTTRDVVLAAIGIPVVIASVICTIGLYSFRSFAPRLTVVVWIVGLVLQAFAGPTVMTGPATSLCDLSNALGGIVLSVIYLTPARMWFEGNREQSNAVV